ncbi:MAG: hypothetical protein H6R10_3041 [Rhodocyclaceae bacterium]|nr:hypothetical protein [Rhodocyclaceae bacterium]
MGMIFPGRDMLRRVWGKPAMEMLSWSNREKAA